MTIEAKVIVDSISEAGKRLTTFQLKYPRFIHAELMTHRVLSRNASSSRAIPVKRMIQDVMDDPAMPIHWGKNIPGMQAKEECAEEVLLRYYDDDEGESFVNYFYRGEAWLEARDRAVEVAQAFANAGYHKQIVNRLLEPFQHIHVVVTATEWNNFFALRRHEDAQPEIKALADAMYEAMQASTPKLLDKGMWHLPYVTYEDKNQLRQSSNSYEEYSNTLIKVSVARCCRVSYLKHDGTPAPIDEDIKLYHRLVDHSPMHASPLEHVATPDWQGIPGGEWLNAKLHGNLVGWQQYRKLLSNECVTG